MRNSFAVTLLPALCFPFLFSQQAAAATIVNAGDVMEVRFSFAAPPVCPGGPCDVLHVSPNQYGAFFLVADQASLFDGVTLLGTQSASTNPNFRSATSLFNTVNSATIDFTSINNGTIDGLFRFTIASGWMEFTGAPGFSLLPARADGPGSTNADPGSFAVITSVTIIPSSAVPEPNTLALLLLAGGAILTSRAAKR